MSYLIGAIFCCVLSIHCLNRGHKIYTEMRGPVTKTVSILFTIVGCGSIWLAYQSGNEFIKVMGW